MGPGNLEMTNFSRCSSFLIVKNSRFFMPSYIKKLSLSLKIYAFIQILPYKIQLSNARQIFWSTEHYMFISMTYKVLAATNCMKTSYYYKIAKISLWLYHVVWKQFNNSIKQYTSLYFVITEAIQITWPIFFRITARWTCFSITTNS